MSELRIIVCGGRDYSDRDAVFRVLDHVNAGKAVTMLFHGNASGADQLGAAWAHVRGVKAFAVPAQWSKHGRAAGPKRNQAMLGNLVPGRDAVVAFPGGRGTADMTRRAVMAGVRVVLHDQPPSEAKA